MPEIAGKLTGGVQSMKWYVKCSVSLFVACCLMLSLDVRHAEAQNFGVVGGLNFTSAEEIERGDVTTTLDNRTGYHLGGYIDIGSDLLWVRPGIHYISAGALYEGIEDDIPVNLQDDFNVRVLAIPVDLRLELGPSFARPYAFIGPVVHFRWLDDAPEAFEDNVQPRDFAGTVGEGVRIGGDHAEIRFVPQFRYTFGLANVLEESISVGDITLNPAEGMSFILVSLALEF